MNSNKNTRMQKVKLNPKKKPQNLKEGGKEKRSRPRAKSNMTKQISVNAAYATGQVGRVPKIMATRDNCRVMHRELISTISGTTSFDVKKFEVNPGLSASFPWLSNMAKSWQRYKFHKLHFCTFTRTGSTTPGSLMLSPDYDPADAAPVSEQVASAYEDTTEDAPWKDMICVLSPKRMHGLGQDLTIRTGPLASNLDIKLYDAANLYVITVDGTNVPWSKLWVEYEVEFTIPQLSPNGDNPLMGGSTSGGGLLTLANPLGGAPITDSDTRGYTVNNASLVTVASVGEFLVLMRISGTGLSAVTLEYDPPTTASVVFAVINAAATQIVSLWKLKGFAPFHSFQVSSTGTSITSSDMFLSQVPVDSV